MIELAIAVVALLVGAGIGFLVAECVQDHRIIERTYATPPDPLDDYEDYLSGQIADADRERRYQEAVERGDLLGAAVVAAERLEPISNQPGEAIYYRPLPRPDRQTWLIPRLRAR